MVVGRIADSKNDVHPVKFHGSPVKSHQTTHVPCTLQGAGQRSSVRQSIIEVLFRADYTKSYTVNVVVLDLGHSPDR